MKMKQFRGKHAAVLSYLKSHPKGGTVFEIQENLKFGDIRKRISDLRKYYKIADIWKITSMQMVAKLASSGMYLRVSLNEAKRKAP